MRRNIEIDLKVTDHKVAKRAITTAMSFGYRWASSVKDLDRLDKFNYLNFDDEFNITLTDSDGYHKVDIENDWDVFLNSIGVKESPLRDEVIRLNYSLEKAYLEIERLNHIINEQS